MPILACARIGATPLQSCSSGFLSLIVFGSTGLQGSDAKVVHHRRNFAPARWQAYPAESQRRTSALASCNRCRSKCLWCVDTAAVVAWNDTRNVDYNSTGQRGCQTKAARQKHDERKKTVCSSSTPPGSIRRQGGLCIPTGAYLVLCCTQPTR